jgi:peptidyl-prolyl cis-trans isomerase D
VPDEDVVRYYARHGAYFLQPERRDLDMIVSWHRRAARAAVDDLRRGADWAEAADRHAASGAVTRLAQRARGDLSEQLARRAFSARVNQIVGPVRAPDGWHVVVVRRIVPRFKMTLDQSRPYIRHLLNQDLRQRAAYDSQQRQLTSYRKRTHCLGPLRISACVNGPAPIPPAPFRGQLDKPVVPALEPSSGR